MELKELIIETFKRKAENGQIESKSNLVKIMTEQSTLNVFNDNFGIDLKELLPELLKIYDQAMVKSNMATDLEMENVSKVKMPSGADYIHIKDQEKSTLIGNYQNENPEKQFRGAETKAILEAGRPVTQEEIARKYALENHTENLYSISERQGYQMSQEEIRNLNIFLATANEQNFDNNDFSVSSDCTKYVNNKTGEIYEIHNSKLIKATKENTNESAEELEVPKEEVVSEEKELLDNLERINYTDEELIEMLTNPTLSEEVRGEISKRITAEKSADGSYILPKAPVKVLIRETPKAAFVNVLILSLISFFFSVMTVLIILVKMQG